MTEFDIIKQTVGHNDYSIIIGRSLLPVIIEQVRSVTNSEKIFVVADSIYKSTNYKNIEEEFRINGLQVYLHVVQGGKANKSIEQVLQILRSLIELEFTRDSTLITIGGGVIGDLGGLAASLFYRGMNLIHLPTTLTSQVDSSIGGKTGVNFHNIVNSLGTFYHPKSVIVDLLLIDSLPEREFLSGLGEIIKCAFIADPNLVEYLFANSKSILLREPEVIRYIVEKSIHIKLQHVSQDIFDKSVRMKLNYGHTIGQSIETTTGLVRQDEYYRHGEAVGLGMLAAAHIGDLFYSDSLNRYKLHYDMLTEFQMPTIITSSDLEIEARKLHNQIFKNTFKDKKRSSDGLRFILLPQIGSADIQVIYSLTLVQEAIIKLIH